MIEIKRLAIVGATSAIAHATALAFLEQEGAGMAFFLVGRNAARLSAVADDLRARGAGVHTFEMDANDAARHDEMLEAARRALGTLDAVLVAHGTLPEQHEAQGSANATLEALQTNAVSVAALLTPLANYFDEQGRGCIAVISSVAGDRGRPSNYVYGSAKAMVTAYLQGLRARLAKRGVAVVTIKPGFVDTPMTAHLPKNPLYASPEVVGRRIVRAMRKGESVVYVPWFWRYVMSAIRAIPEPLFKRLSL